jgi:hypothetical protein
MRAKWIFLCASTCILSSLFASELPASKEKIDVEPHLYIQPHGPRENIVLCDGSSGLHRTFLEAFLDKYSLRKSYRFWTQRDFPRGLPVTSVYAGPTQVPQSVLSCIQKSEELGNAVKGLSQVPAEAIHSLIFGERISTAHIVYNKNKDVSALALGCFQSVRECAGTFAEYLFFLHDDFCEINECEM